MKRGDWLYAIHFWNKAREIFPESNQCYIGIKRCLKELDVPEVISMNLTTATSENKEEQKTLERSKRSENELDYLIKDAVEGRKDFNLIKELWNEWYSYKPKTFHFYYTTGTILKRIVQDGLEGQDPEFEKNVVTSLANQEASSSMEMSFPIICHNLFHLIQTEHNSYQALIKYLKEMFPKCGIDYLSGMSIAVIAISFDFADKETKRKILEKYFVQITLHEQWYIILWIKNYENISLFNEMIEHRMDDIISSNLENIYHFLLVTSCVNHTYFLKLLEKLPKRLLQVKEGITYKKDLEYISGVKDLAAESKKDLDLFKNFDPTIKFPSIIKFPDKPLNIAVCVSGQLRGYQEAFQTWKNVLNFDNHNITYFVNVWKHIGRKWPNPPSDERSMSGKFLEAWRLAWSRLGENEVKARYKNFLEIFTGKGSEVTEEELMNFYGTKHIMIENDHLPPYSFYHNAKKMYHKVYHCHKMARESGNNFDLMIRMRPDREIAIRPEYADQKTDLAKMYHDSINNHALYCENGRYLHPDPRYIIGDQLAIAAPNVMDKYAIALKVTDYARKKDLTGFPEKLVAHINFSFATLYQQVLVRELEVVGMQRLVDTKILDPQLIFAAISKDILLPRDEIDEMLINAARSDLAK